MDSTYVGYNNDLAHALLVRVIEEGADAHLVSDTDFGMNGHPEWMGHRLVFCDHGRGPLLDALRTGADQLHTNAGTFSDNIAREFLESIKAQS